MAGARFRLFLLTRATLVATSRLGGHQALKLPRGSRTPPHRHSGLSLGLDRQPAPHVAQALVVDPQDPVLVPEIPDLGHEAPELGFEPQGAVHVRVGLVHGLVAFLEDLADDGREGHGGVGALELGRRGHDFLEGHHQRHGDLLNTIESPLFLLQEIPLLLKLGLPVNGIEPARTSSHCIDVARHPPGVDDTVRLIHHCGRREPRQHTLTAISSRTTTGLAGMSLVCDSVVDRHALSSNRQGPVRRQGTAMLSTWILWPSRRKLLQCFSSCDRPQLHGLSVQLMSQPHLGQDGLIYLALRLFESSRKCRVGRHGMRDERLIEGMTLGLLSVLSIFQAAEIRKPFLLTTTTTNVRPRWKRRNLLMLPS
ncbi:hypothetical protein PG995_010377 [Apiospora arundinis]